jgi:hypothetical protein
MAKIELDITLLRTSDFAFLVQSDVGKGWVPRKGNAFEPKNRAPEHRWKLPLEGVLTVHENMALDKGLI